MVLFRLVWVADFFFPAGFERGLIDFPGLVFFFAGLLVPDINELGFAAGLGPGLHFFGLLAGGAGEFFAGGGGMLMVFLCVPFIYSNNYSAPLKG